MRLYLSMLAVFIFGIARAQSPGSVQDPAVLPNPMDPNADGWITLTGAPFSGPLDETEFELPFIPIPEYQPEPVPDNQVPSTSCTMYELVGDAAKGVESTYYYYRDPDGIPDSGDELVFFRFRIARIMNSSVGLSILIDTDHRFGFSGPEADPNAVVGNPGFELEISVTTGTGNQIRVYNVDGVTSPGVATYSYSGDTNFQIAYALNQDPDCSMRIPGFIDIYLPFSALNISASAQIRMVGASGELTGSLLGGRASDIAGVDGNAIPSDDNQFIAVIGSYPQFSFQDGTNRPPVAVDASQALDENASNGTAVHTVSASDPDGDALTYTITGGNTSSAFAINSSGQITVSNAAALNYETTPSFGLSVRVSDGTLFDDAAITINLNNINESPLASDATASINENAANGTAVHTVPASDPDGDALTYTITGGNTSSAFAINSSGQITVLNAAALNYETTPSFNLTVRVSDGTLFDDAAITINLNNINESPSAIDATTSVNENSANGTAVHTVSASDPAGNALSYTITGGNTSSAFSINTSGQITVSNSAALNYETTPSFALTVRVSDGTLFVDATITVNLNDINESPSAIEATTSVNENSANGTAVHTVSASDPDGEVLNYTITGGNTSSAFSINSAGQITVSNAAALNYETTPSFNLIVRVSDGTLFDDVAITINLNNINEIPSAVDATASVNENAAYGIAVHTVSASDPDGDVLDYTITAGNTGGAFAINGSGQITVSNAAALNYETTPSFALTVSVSDGTLFDDAAISINLNDVNESFSALDATEGLNENSPVGTPVHTVSVSNPGGKVLTYTITSGNTNSAFAINTVGQITVTNAAVLDFETMPSFSLLITISDGAMFDDAVITISLTDINETPSANGAVVSISENSVSGTAAHTVAASDPDGDILTYTITAGNPNNAFSVSNDGVISVSASSQLDFETSPTFALTIMVSDGERFTEAPVAIDLLDINELPRISDASMRIPGDVPKGTVVHQIVSDDPDAGDTRIFSIESGNSDSAFEINETSGEILVNNIERAATLPNPVIEMGVMVKDAGGLTATAKITIEIEKIDKKNIVNPLKGFSPDGDGINDLWLIQGIEAFPDNEVKIFNRWGNLVFNTRNYNNNNIAWRGESDGRGSAAERNTPETTFFYIITINGLHPLTGYVIMKQ